VTQRKNILNALGIQETVLLRQHHGGGGITEASVKAAVAALQQQRCHGSSAITTAVAPRHNCRMKRA